MPIPRFARDRHRGKTNGKTSPGVGRVRCGCILRNAGTWSGSNHSSGLVSPFRSRT
eukprot:gene26338-biopygen15917